MVYLKKDILLENKKNKIPQIGILNLMPNKIETEQHFINILSQVPINIFLYFIRLKTYIPENSSFKYLKENYVTFDKVKDNLDGLIITGAPLEFKDFKDVKYWVELEEIMDFSNKNIKSTIYICWAVSAGLYFHYNIPKYNLKEKVFGVFTHNITDIDHRLFKGFDDTFSVPHSRYFFIREEDINKTCKLDILSISEEAGVFLVADKGCSKIFLTGHLEYSADTLKKEYKRDIEKGLKIKKPKNYDIYNAKSLWRAHATLFYTNWIYEYLIGNY